MSFDDNENLYILEEEIDHDNDSSPLNFAAYQDEEREEEPELSQKEIHKSPFLLLLNIMFNPVEGWKSLRRSKSTPETLQAGCFYPLLAVLALSKFMDFIYSVDIPMTQVVTQAVITFVSFFFGYFSIPIILSWFLPKEMTEKFEKNFGKTYTLIALSTLVLFSIIMEILPMLWPILIFLPIWTLYVMFKGIRFFHFKKEEEWKFFILAGASVIGVPMIIDWTITYILPY